MMTVAQRDEETLAIVRLAPEAANETLIFRYNEGYGRLCSLVRGRDFYGLFGDVTKGEPVVIRERTADGWVVAKDVMAMTEQIEFASGVLLVLGQRLRYPRDGLYERMEK